MSLSSTGGGSTGGEIESAIRQIIEQYLAGLQITSAGGDSPKINTVENLPEVAGFGDIIDNAVQTTVVRHMEDNGMFGTLGDGDVVPSDSGLTEGQGVGIARGAVSRIQNPASMISEGLGFLPHAALVSFAISIIPIIIEELTKPGGPFDLRFKRVVEKEFNSLMDRQTAFDISIGERGVIIQSRAGMINRNGGALDTNTLRTIREGGINKQVLNEIDYIDHSQGMF